MARFAPERRFELDASIIAEDARCPNSFKALAVFPWNKGDLGRLWGGEFARSSEKKEAWDRIITKWAGVVAVCGGPKVRLILTRPNQPYMQLNTICIDNKGADVRAVTWALIHDIDGIYPLLVFSAESIIYILKVETGNYHGVLRGHGGQINALAVQPEDPAYLASASHDYSVRIYDLRQSIVTEIDNPSWPNSNRPAYAGPAFGLRANEQEGHGFGNCVAILAGGASGGHQAAVLDVAFHPSLPIIATSGMDHAVKIWRFPVLQGNPEGTRIAREDKPCFSSTRIHKSRVCSISWLSEDILLSHCAPVAMRNVGTEQLNFGPGTLVLWKWLGLRRFFPLDQGNRFPALMRGCLADFHESSSYKIISEYKSDPDVNRYASIKAHVYQTNSVTPIICMPWKTTVAVTSIHRFEPRISLPLPPKPRKDPDHGDYDSDEETTPSYADLLPDMPCQLIQKDKDHRVLGIKSCTVAENGKLLIGVGEREGIWIWRERRLDNRV